MKGEGARRTCWAFAGTSVLETPFWVAFVLLPIIAYKDLHASAWIIAAIYSIKPIAALFSPYWSSWIERRPDRIISNIVWARLISHLPFFFFPWVESSLYIVAVCGLYMLLKRGVIPAWMELLKLNLPSSNRSRLFAWVSSARYIGDAIVPFILGPILDSDVEAWRWVFPLLALISLAALPWQLRVTIPGKNKLSEEPAQFRYPSLLSPWKTAWKLLKERPDFLRFQLGFMLGGAGLILILPAIPMLFTDELALSYTEMSVALSGCKGVGFALTSPLWARWMARIDLFRLTSFVTALAAVFPVFLMLSQLDLAWLYIGYICYGVMQGGSELSWNLSGPAFAQEADSSIYSSINVAAVGIRGCFASPLGSLLIFLGTPTLALVAGGFLCASATLLLMISSRRFSVPQLFATS